jgi:hypothetical protein
MIITSDSMHTNTEHGLLVAFGEFLQQHGLLKQLLAVPIHQKTLIYSPQTKLIEFLAGIFGGIEYLSDLNDASHPIAKDPAVARAWSLTGFAHYSGVSRTLDVCDAQTVAATQRAIEIFSQPFIRTSVHELLRMGKVLTYDFDLTGQAVSATSTTYPNARFGWMDDQVHLGYQLARVCLTTVTGERLWLQGFHHPGDTVSANCLHELVGAAEAQTQVRPRRRPDLVQQRVAASEQLMERPRRLLAQQHTKHTQLEQTELRVRLDIAQAEKRLKMPDSTAQTERRRKTLTAWQARLPRLAQQRTTCEHAIAHHQEYLNELAHQVTELKTWQAQLEQENQANPDAPVCEARMDSGFSGGANVTWLIEMGYQVNTKAPSDKTTNALRKTVTPETPWTRVGANAEMTTPVEYTMQGCAYPLRAALERFKLGETFQYATLIQFSDAGTPPELAAWFQSYNGRQTIEAGNKELKSGVFHVQHLMTRSAAGIQLQVLFAGLAANSVRWAVPWLHTCAAALTPKFEQTLTRPKHLVRVAANTAALVQQTTTGTALRFASNSALPGVTLVLKGIPAFQLPLAFQTPLQN